MNLPPALISSLEGIPGFDRDAFLAVHAEAAAVTSVRLNTAKSESSTAAQGDLLSGLAGGELLSGLAGGDRLSRLAGEDLLSGLVQVQQGDRVAWSSSGYYLPRRPSFTFDPRFHAGAYYVQEASGMFLEQVMRQTTDLLRPIRVLDLCAAPGGKSTLLQSLLSAESLLVSNEVIRNRVHILGENIVKWGGVNGVVTSNDPHDFGRLENYFDVIVVDAPCSGSGLFRRDPEAIKEWSPDNVRLCSQRQQRILADCWPALRQGGSLVYSTCSYSREENEDIVEWIIRDLGAESCRLSVPAEWRIVETGSGPGGYGYRFYPDKLRGEGLYMSCVRKTGGSAYVHPRKKSGFDRLANKDVATVTPLVTPGAGLAFFQHKELIHAIPEALFSELPVLGSACYLRRAGLPLGKISPKEFIPEHDLAMCVAVSRDLPAISLSKEDALRYLRKDELPPEPKQRGWTLVRYSGLNLGWIKVLPGRINNYYPKEWRILRREP
jgi:16S rRNA C967 or C1407 C5-methylase (RsmB/RsmF family)/NOL1/NOP2/fmu family ribosome biogenesis protein